MYIYARPEQLELWHVLLEASLDDYITDCLLAILIN
jgi:hypothetical protein